MPIKRKIISVPVGNVQKLAKAHGITSSGVYNALNYNSNSALAQLIREQALKLYGGVQNTKIVF
jgi:DNA-binding phage protein